MGITCLWIGVMAAVAGSTVLRRRRQGEYLTTLPEDVDAVVMSDSDDDDDDEAPLTSIYDVRPEETVEPVPEFPLWAQMTEKTIVTATVLGMAVVAYHEFYHDYVTLLV